MGKWTDLKNRLLVGGTRFVDVRGFWLRNEMEAMQRLPKYADPLSLIPHGRKVYSQNEEDGIIIEIFNRIGTTNKTFVEFGSGDGLENNTYALLFQDWNGLWIDGSPKNIRKIREGLPTTIDSGQLAVVESFITKDNINDLISPHIQEKEIDLLSVDIDGNDYFVWDAITCIEPRVLIMEYNARFVPPIRYCMAYDPKHMWNYTDHGGLSLKFIEEKAAAKGYSLVGCSLSGANAFFVRNDLLAGKFEAPFTAEKHYEPARPHFAKIKSGHPSCFRTLEKRLKED
ncbi:MAG: hypothetical protein HKP10_00200 [Kiritimatiellales bacterium]|nr:hypothetical protein [Pontiella sp.]NNJ69689.1 hypothetical protein [Kiritimatiellales bacterium]